MEALKEMLTEFIDWARDCGEDAWYIFENPDEAIERFLKETQSDEDEEPISRKKADYY